MADFVFDRITGVKLLGIGRGLSRPTASESIPGGRTRTYGIGVDAPSLRLNCRATSAMALIQVAELVDNPDYPFFWIGFPSTLTNETNQSGLYVVESADIPRESSFGASYFPFTLSVRRIANLATHRLAQAWTAAAEMYSGANWAGALTANRLISLPYLAANPDSAVLETRATIDPASNQVLLNPTRQVISFDSSAMIANWWLAECKVFDSVTAGDTTEANWVQVYSPSHIFGGDCIIQNGMMRYKIAASLCTFYALDTVTNPNGWLSIGDFKTALTGGNDAPRVRWNITKLSPDAIEWQETRQYSTTPIRLTFSLRRGAYHCKIALATFAQTIDTATYVQLNGTGFFAQLFNASANGAGGAGDLTTDATHNYHCGYNTSRNIVAGFALCDQPTKQPKDTSTAVLAESNTWGAGATRTFFVFGFSQNTASFNLTTGRATANAIAAQCLHAVEQTPCLVERGFYA